MNSLEKKYFDKLINKYLKKPQKLKNYPLSSPKPFSNEDLMQGVKVLLGGQVTMSDITRKFEKEFAKYVGSKYALMVNSGSSANLLSLFALINPEQKNKVVAGSNCLIPALCWSTSLWPIVQAGLIPKFSDINLKTLNLETSSLEKLIDKKTKIILAVHVLGNSTNMNELKRIVRKHDLILIEDTCESLGSKYKNKYLGTFGKFGTYSFYISHQITSGEGGMIVCDNKDDYNLIFKLRAHGWDRGLNKKPKNTFNFINSGFNLRPMDLTAAMGFSQFKRLNKMKKIRSINRSKIIIGLKNSDKWQNQFTFLEPIDHLEPSWFGLPIILRKDLSSRKKQFLKHLNHKGIETRPIISGNFLNQPCVKLYNLEGNPKNYKNAQEVEERGFFIGLHTDPITQKELNLLIKNLLKI
jgi:CDP-4-dehydro-6-deoxyglucose reductase, E1